MKHKAYYPILFFFLLSLVLIPNAVKAQSSTNNKSFDVAFGTLVTPLISGFYDYNNHSLVRPEGSPSQIAQFTGNFPEFRVSTSGVNFLKEIDYGARLVPYYFDNGTQTQVRAYMKDYVCAYSMQIETTMVDSDFTQNPYDRIVPLYQLWRNYFFQYYHQSQYDLNVKIPDYQYDADYYAKASRVAQGEIYVDYVCNPVQAFPQGDVSNAFLPSWQSNLGDYSFVNYWIGVVQSNVGGLLSNGFTDQHGISYLESKQKYDPAIPSIPTGGNVRVSYDGVINAYNTTIIGGVLGLPSVNTGLTLTRLNDNETYDPNAFNSVMYNGHLLGEDDLEMRAKYPIEIAPKVDQYFADHGLHGYKEFQTDPDGYLPLYGWKTDTLENYADVERANLGITVANRYATVTNNLTIRIISFYDFEPLLPENEYQLEPYGVTGDRSVNPVGWGVTEAVVTQFDIYGALWGSIIAIAVLIVALYVVVKIAKRQSQKPFEEGQPKSRFLKYKWIIYAGIIGGFALALVLVLYYTGLFSLFL